MRYVYALAALLSLASCTSTARPGANSTSNFVPDSGGPVGGTVIDAGAECRSEGVLCDGQTPYRCAPDGTRMFMTSCPSAQPFCTSGIGCLACRPASARCNPERPDTPQRCADDGGRWVDQASCDGAMGQRCTEGRCGDPCSVPDGAQQYLGCDYWATQTPNSQLYRGFPFAVALANPQSFAVMVQIRGGALEAPRDETLAAGEVRAIELPWVQDLVQSSTTSAGCVCRPTMMDVCEGGRPASSAVVRNGAYQIHATAPVAAYQFNPLNFELNSGARCFNSFTNDASLLLSQRALTQRYLVLTAPHWSFQVRDGSRITLGGFVAITVANSNESTSVTVQLPRNHGVADAPDGVIRHENLAPGDVVVIVGSGPGDLSGALIEASAPVAVFAGHDCTNVPQSQPACDHLEEQILPLETLGRDYVISDLRDRSVGSVVRMIAPFDNTVVRFEPETVSPPRRLNAREVMQITARGSFRVRSTRPLMVMQLMIGLGTGSSGAGDPAMVSEVPVQQFRDRYDLLVPDTYTSNFLGVVAPHGSRVLLDEAALMGDTENFGAWDILHAPVMPGRHRLRTAEGVPLGVKVYGTARYTSYMYPGGLDLRLLPPG